MKKKYLPNCKNRMKNKQFTGKTICTPKPNNRRQGQEVGLAEKKNCPRTILSAKATRPQFVILTTLPHKHLNLAPFPMLPS
jgi:hypothetical protein